VLLVSTGLLKISLNSLIYNWAFFRFYCLGNVSINETVLETTGTFRPAFNKFVH
jgi:hypothetical protein